MTTGRRLCHSDGCGPRRLNEWKMFRVALPEKSLLVGLNPTADNGHIGCRSRLRPVQKTC